MECRVKSGKYLVVALACLAGSVCCIPIGSNETEFGKDHPTLLVENIRRQLMNENYDYMPSESEDMVTIKHELGDEGTTFHPPTLLNNTNDFINQLDSDINDHFIQSRAKEQSIDNLVKDKSHSISKEDLPYYVDEHRLKRTSPAPTALQDKSETTTTIAGTVKYKILKVKQPPSNRRSQKKPYRRFIQEEGENGVVLVNLDDEPFPEFRLPRARRQYMMDRDHFDSDVELAASTAGEEDFLETGFENMQERFRAHCGAAATTLLNNKDIKLVDLLKQHLRTNNDDYVEKANISKVIPPAINKHSGGGGHSVVKTKVKQRHTSNYFNASIVHENADKDTNRRQLNFDISSVENDYYNFSTVTNGPSVAVPTNINPNRLQKTQPSASSEPSLHYTATTASNNRHKANKNAMKVESQTMPILTTSGSPEQAKALRAGLRKDTSTPEQRELDMAPAKGGRIYNMRIKGRMCDRSVLIPEGPKYDSKGAIYLKAFQRKGEKDYPNTRAPELVLPKCCNCCKKSVLGCE